jgi:hypothetical protein
MLHETFGFVQQILKKLVSSIEQIVIVFLLLAYSQILVKCPAAGSPFGTLS